MVEKAIRKLIRRVIRWAFTDEYGIAPVLNIATDIHISRSKAEEIFTVGASTPGGRKMVINTIRSARVNREL